MRNILVMFKNKHPRIRKARGAVLGLALSMIFFACTPIFAKVVSVPSSMVDPGKLESVADLVDTCASQTWTGRISKSTVLLLSRLLLTEKAFVELEKLRSLAPLAQCD
ncbi:TPA: hypothetical protein I8273_004761 [Aeromonas hydrophila]|nr:hypothetical protein [Aeromonas hydrophila]HAT2639216.1 hypothetical protein [Aeromonas hydrophila]HAT3424417.1 hypothetical protein [Aeromonas hydrophila]HAT3534400.1 hypothetical protein [Aeromonas hydrophila]